MAVCDDGRVLLAISVPPGVPQVAVQVDLAGPYAITDEWTGDEVVRGTFTGEPWVIDVDPGGDGLVFSLVPR